MASKAVDVGAGMTVGFGTSSYAPQIEGMTYDGAERTIHESTKLASTAATPGTNFGGREFFGGDLADPGTITLTVHFNPDDDIPLHAAEETITYTFPIGTASAATYAGTGFVSAFSISGIEPDGKMLADITIKMSGLITVVASA